MTQDDKWTVRLLESWPNPEDQTYKAEIEGPVTAGAIVEIQVGRRTYTTVARSNGIVRTEIRLPASVRTIRGTVRPQPHDPGSIERHLYLNTPSLDRNDTRTALTLDLAIVATNQSQLWIAGRSAPSALLEVRSHGETIGPPTISADFGGFYDARLIVTGVPPTDVSVRTRSDAAWRSETPNVRVSATDRLPVTRTATLRFEKGIPLGVFKTTLPANHPLFRDLVKGHLSGLDFLYSAWGDTAYETGDFTAPELRIGVEDGLGTVEWDTRWSGPVDEVRLGGGSLLAGGGLLLSTEDRIDIAFGEVVPLWFGDPLPGELSPTNARWRGPLTKSDIRLGVELPAGVQARLLGQTRSLPLGTNAPVQPRPEPPQPTMRDWVATDANNGSWPRQVWHQGVALLPALAFLVLARRQSQAGNRPVWTAAATAAALLAAPSLWYLLYRASMAVTWPWLSNLYRLPLGADSVPADSALGSTLSRASLNACVMVAAVLAGLGFAYSEGPQPAPAPPNSGRTSLDRTHARRTHSLWAFLRRLRPAWMWIRVAWFAACASLVAALALWVNELRWNDAARAWTRGSISKIWDLHPDEAGDILAGLRDDRTLLTLLALLAPLLLATFGWRAFLFGLGILLLALTLVTPSNQILTSVQHETGMFDVAGWIPIKPLVALVAVLACIWIAQLLSWLIPADQIRQHRRLLCTLAPLSALGSMALPFLPGKLALAAGGVGLSAVLVTVFLRGGCLVEPVAAGARWTFARRGRVWVVGAILAAAVAWPVQRQDDLLAFSDLYGLFGIYVGVFPLLIGALFLLVLKDCSSRSDPAGGVLEEGILDAGVVFFAFFVIQSNQTWVFIPVPFVVGWFLARLWLIERGEALGPVRTWLAEDPARRREYLADALAGIKAQSQVDAVEKALGKKLESGELSPEDYRKRLEPYLEYRDQRLGGSKGQASIWPAGVFAAPAGTPWHRGLRFAGLGALLAAVPLVLTLYEYLPGRTVAYPYPNADLVSVLLRSLAGWLLGAFFFGYFFVHIRGRSGLTKGLFLCVAMLAPVGLHRLLNAPKLDELRPFLLWSSQVFAFCALLGGASDYRALRAFGYRLRDLLILHNLPWLSVYASAIVAAVLPGIVALLSGKIGDLVKFFVDTVLAPSARLAN